VNIYIYIPRVMASLVHHLDPKVEPTGEPVDRPSHPDSYARPPARPESCPRLPPTRGPALPPLRAPAVPFTSHPRSIATRPGPAPHAQRRACSRIPRLRIWLSHFLRFCRMLRHFCYNVSIILFLSKPF
jgi:hypothetical protein